MGKWQDEKLTTGGGNTPCSQRMSWQAGYVISQSCQEQSKCINTSSHYLQMMTVRLSTRYQNPYLTSSFELSRMIQNQGPASYSYEQIPLVCYLDMYSMYNLNFLMKMLYGQLLGWLNSSLATTSCSFGEVVSPVCSMSQYTNKSPSVKRLW
jgi:hypothetical protein